MKPISRSIYVINIFWRTFCSELPVMKNETHQSVVHVRIFPTDDINIMSKYTEALDVNALGTNYTYAYIFNAEAWVRAQVSPCGICGGQSGGGTGFSSILSVCICQYHTIATVCWHVYHLGVGQRGR
jgi:hypothetical protein